MWATRASFTRITHTWRVCLTSARRFKKPVSCATNLKRTPPGKWVSLQSVESMPVWTLAQRHLREVPWSSSLVALTWTFFTNSAVFFQKSISTWSWCHLRTTFSANRQHHVKVRSRKITSLYLKRRSNYSHQEAHKHCKWRAHGSSCDSKYNASLFARPNKAPVDSRKTDCRSTSTTVLQAPYRI